MDLQSRKIEFIQEFLKLESESAISRLEKLLRKENTATTSVESKSLSKEELNNRIEQSEADFKNNRFKTTDDLLSKYK